MADKQVIVGIDEAGRGPLAGPVYVGVVALNRGFDFQQFPNLTDSKQMSEDDREFVYDDIVGNTDSEIMYTIRYATPELIDKNGINTAISRAINRGLRNLGVSKGSRILLDGGLSAPNKYNQESITGGDKKEPAISLASVLAKVARDRYMRKIDGRYDFDFAQHKGYGTKKHRQRINERGACEIHRMSFVNGES